MCLADIHKNTIKQFSSLPQNVKFKKNAIRKYNSNFSKPIRYI